MTDFPARLADAACRVEAALEALLPQQGADAAGRLAAAMRHGALGGGKRLRGFLCLESAALFGAQGAERVAAAAEMLHAYSLIHDDLPAMDDDDLRRGRPTVHVAYDEATAILAGDALQTLAFETLADPATHPDGALRAELALALARASGAGGMVAGQALDIAAEGAALDEAAVTRLQALKTGALIRFAAESGAILAAASGADRARLAAYAADLGLAFQIRDDLLDIEADPETAGKRTGKDEAAGKATFVSLLGAEGARARAEALVRSAAAHLAPFGARAEALAQAARFALGRSA